MKRNYERGYLRICGALGMVLLALVLLGAILNRIHGLGLWAFPSNLPLWQMVLAMPGAMGTMVMLVVGVLLLIIVVLAVAVTIIFYVAQGIHWFAGVVGGPVNPTTQEQQPHPL